MELKTRFNPGQEVHFMFDNKAVIGTVQNLILRASINKGEPLIKITYNIRYVYKVEVDTTLGFAGNQDPHKERYFDVLDNQVFENKEELLKSL